MRNLIIVIDKVFAYTFPYFENNKSKLMQKNGISLNSEYEIYSEKLIDSGKLKDIYNK